MMKYINETACLGFLPLERTRAEGRIFFEGKVQHLLREGFSLARFSLDWAQSLAPEYARIQQPQRPRQRSLDLRAAQTLRAAKQPVR